MIYVVTGRGEEKEREGKKIKRSSPQLSLTSASEPFVTMSTDVSKAIAEFKVSKAPGPNDVPNRT